MKTIVIFFFLWLIFSPVIAILHSEIELATVFAREKGIKAYHYGLRGLIRRNLYRLWMLFALPMFLLFGFLLRWHEFSLRYWWEGVFYGYNLTFPNEPSFVGGWKF